MKIKLDPKELLDHSKTNKAIFESQFNLEEEAWRSAVLEMALETLGYSPIDLWNGNKLETSLEEEE